MEQNKNKALAQALVDAGYLTPNQITKALEYQCRLPPGQYRSLSQILVDFEYVTEAQIREVMGTSLEELSDPIAQVLLEQGLVSNQQLEQALQILDSFPRSHVGDVLIDLGFATELDVGQAISHHQLTQSRSLKAIMPYPSAQSSQIEVPEQVNEDPSKETGSVENEELRAGGSTTDLSDALSVPLSRHTQETTPAAQSETVHLPLGRKLIARGLISEDELEDAIQYQQRLPKVMYKPLGEILVDQGYISQDQMEDILNETPPPPKSRIGEILVNAGLLEKQQLSHALSLQFRPEHANKRLGSLLVELGYARREDIEAVVAGHYQQGGGSPAAQSSPPPSSAEQREPPKTPHRPLGQILVDKGYITQAQLQQALKKQVTHADEYTPLGDILLLEGWVSESQLQEALAQQPGFQHTPIGQILIAEEVIEEWQLAHALCQQFDPESGEHLNLGSILVKLGYAEQDVIESAVIRFFKRQREADGDQ